MEIFFSNNVRKIFLVIFGLTLSFAVLAKDNETVRVQIQTEPKNYAWWVRIIFEPVNKTIHGLSIGEIDATWILASVLQKEAIPADSLIENGRDTMQFNSVDFFQNGDFNDDGQDDRALVGVFKDKKNRFGNFILILTKQKSGLLKKEFLRTWVRRQGFLAISYNEKQLVLWFCMECGGSSPIIWNRKTQTYELLPSVDDEILTSR